MLTNGIPRRISFARILTAETMLLQLCGGGLNQCRTTWLQTAASFPDEIVSIQPTVSFCGFIIDSNLIHYIIWHPSRILD
jgi:hypothetical protein